MYSRPTHFPPRPQRQTDALCGSVISQCNSHSRVVVGVAHALGVSAQTRNAQSQNLRHILLKFRAFAFLLPFFRSFRRVPYLASGLSFFQHTRSSNMQRQDAAAGRRALASAVGTAVAEYVTQPFCALKTHVQNDAHAAGVYASRGTLAAARRVAAVEGAGVFFRAAKVAVATQVLSTASKFTLYHALQDAWNRDRTSFGRSVGSGLVSGWASSIVTHPLDVIKIHMQMGATATAGAASAPKTTTAATQLGFGTVAAQLWQQPRLLYRGFSKTLGKVTVGSALFFPLNDAMLRVWGGLVGDDAKVAPAAACAAVVSTVATHAFDCAKTRKAFGQPWFFGFSSIAPYFTGLQLNLLRIVPHFTIVMTVAAAVEARLL